MQTKEAQAATFLPVQDGRGMKSEAMAPSGQLEIVLTVITPLDIKYNPIDCVMAICLFISGITDTTEP